MYTCTHAQHLRRIFKIGTIDEEQLQRAERFARTAGNSAELAIPDDLSFAVEGSG